MRTSLACCVLFYLTLAQTVALVTSRQLQGTPVSPLQMVLNNKDNFVNNWLLNHTDLLQRSTDLGSRLSKALLPEMHMLTVKIEHPVKASNPLFLTLHDLSSSSGKNETARQSQPQQDPITGVSYTIVNTKYFPLEEQPQDSQPAAQYDTTISAPGLAAINSKLKFVADNVVADKTETVTDSATTALKTINPATVQANNSAGSNTALLAWETSDSLHPDKQRLDSTPDADNLLSSKTFVSAIKSTSNPGYSFDLYELTVENLTPLADVNFYGVLTTSETQATSEKSSIAQANPDGKGTAAAGVYKKNLPGLLAYDVVQPVVVVIDAGHGGVDPGTIGKLGLLEKDLTLDMAKRLQTLSELHSDIKVVLNRNDTYGLSRTARVESVKSTNADLLISLHFNSLPEGDITLVETYYTDANAPAGFTSTSSPEKQMAEATSLAAQDQPTLGPSERNKISRKLARHLQSSVFSAVQNRNPLAIDAGVKKERLYLLDQSGIPGALVELTCLSNPQEENRLRIEDYRNELAQSLMSALEAFVDSETLAKSI